MNPGNKFYPLYHSLQFLLTASFLLLSVFFIACPHCHSHPPGIAPDRRSRLAPIPPSSVCTSLDRVPFAFIFNPKSLIPKDLRIHHQTSSILIFCLLLLAGDVEINPGPVRVIPPTLKLATFNIRSASSITHLYNKPDILKHIIHDHQIDILCLSETWLDPNTLPATINSLLPPSFSFSHCPRPQGGGGGVGIIYNPKISAKSITLPNYSSFEIHGLSFTVSPTLNVRPSSITTAPHILLNIYRPPSLSKATFISEFTSLLEDYISSSSEILITGDFNLHLDDPNAPYVDSFLDLLDTFGLTQHIHFPTHDSGHTLDLLITRSASNLVSSTDHTFSPISDHKVIYLLYASPQIQDHRVSQN